MTGRIKLKELASTAEGQNVIKRWMDDEMTRIMVEVVEEYSEPEMNINANDACVDPSKAILDYGAVRRARRIYRLLKDPTTLCPNISGEGDLDGLESAYGADSILKQQGYDMPQGE